MRRSLTYVLGPAIQAALNHPEHLTEDQARQYGQAARAVLRTAWEAEPRDKRLIFAAIAMVAGTFTSDADASETLLRRIIDPARLPDYGHEELPALERELPRLFDIAPRLCSDIYAAAFSYEEESDDATVMTSGVLPLTSNRRQDYQMARYGLAEESPRFFEAAPAAALDAVIAALRAYGIRRAYGSDRGPAVELVPLEGTEPARFIPDRSGIWDQYPLRDEPEFRMLRAFQERLEHLAETQPDEARDLLGRLLSAEAPASMWRRAFLVGAAHPDVLAELLVPLAASPVVLRSADIAQAAITFSATTFPDLDNEQRAAIEKAILYLPATVEDEDREREERRRDRLLAELPEEALVTLAARDRYAELKAENRAPRQPPQSADPDWRESTYRDVDALRDEGVDVEAEPNQRVQEAISPVETFATTYRNELPSIEAARGVLPALRDLLDAVRIPGAHRLQIDTAWGYLAQAARAISRQSAHLSCSDEVRAITQDILLEAGDHPRPDPSDDDPASFDESPSWAGPAPRVDAADGLIRLASRPDCEHGDLVAAIERLAHDPSPPVRHHVAAAIGILGNSEIDTMWSIIDDLVIDPSTSVREVLVHSLHGLLGVDRPRSLATVRKVFASIDPEAPGAARLGHQCVNVVADVYIAEGEHEAGRLIDDLIERLPATAAEAGSIVLRLRPLLTQGSVAEPDERTDVMRGRAVDYISRVVMRSIEVVRSTADGQPRRMDEWNDNALEQWKETMKLIDRIANELYFASGAYDAGRQQHPQPQPTVAQQRLYTEAAAIIDGLVEVGAPRIAHHLLETLEYFIDVDPRATFIRIVQTIRAGQVFGYQYDPMAETLFVRLVERYLAEHRPMLLQDEECRRGLVEMLDVFVRAGWQSARRMTYGLSDIYR
jgi:hypothetical protein